MESYEPFILLNNNYAYMNNVRCGFGHEFKFHDREEKNWETNDEKNRFVFHFGV